jgi:hypothetical protein
VIAMVYSRSGKQLHTAALFALALFACAAATTLTAADTNSSDRKSMSACLL